MRILRRAGFLFIYAVCVALGFYEVTAKSPTLLGASLPNWELTCHVERATPWQPQTGLLPVDKFWHETQEATLFYGALLGRPD